ncbi:hypothetical protein PYCC9005_003771 [Savitreella phatthalungensis]
MPTGYYTREDGIVIGPDGKPCKQCNSFKALMSLGGQPVKTSDTAKPSEISETKKDETVSLEQPPDVEVLGRASWTLLHTTAANYPALPTPVQQNDMAAFLRTFAQFYPCGMCAQDLREWMSKAGNQPVLDRGWAGLGQ